MRGIILAGLLAAGSVSAQTVTVTWDARALDFMSQIVLDITAGKEFLAADGSVSV